MRARAAGGDSRASARADLDLCSSHSSQRATGRDRLGVSGDPSGHQEHALAPSKKEQKKDEGKGGKSRGVSGAAQQSGFRDMNSQRDRNSFSSGGFVNPNDCDASAQRGTTQKSLLKIRHTHGEASVQLLGNRFSNARCTCTVTDTTVSEESRCSRYEGGVRKGKPCKSRSPAGPPPWPLPRKVHRCKSFSCVVSANPERNRNGNYAAEVGVREARERSRSPELARELLKAPEGEAFPQPQQQLMKTSSCSEAAGELQESHATYNVLKSSSAPTVAASRFGTCW